MKTPQWEKDFDALIGRPVSGARIKEFIRKLLKNETQNKENYSQEQMRQEMEQNSQE